MSNSTKAALVALALGTFAPLAAAGPTPKPPAGLARATFAGGCFWCMQPPFDATPGVVSTTVGFTGGTTANPAYPQSEEGGHAEAVEVVYDPKKVSYEQLLDVFWHNVDPFQRDGQFCDEGREYRTAIFVHDGAQRAAARASKEAVARRFGKEPVTEIAAAGPFWPAGKEHQKYAQKNPIRYKVYRYGCGRDKRLEEIWGADAPKH